MRFVSQMKLVAILLSIAVVGLPGCGGGSDDDSGSVSLDQSREAWVELDPSEKEDLARSCRAEAAEAAHEISEGADGGASVRQDFEGVDLDALVGRIDQWYEGASENPGSIRNVCFAEAQDLAVTEIPSDIEEDLQEP